nr:integrase, catalytic region, zinc finger, CCHC-type, peptidase aspartic, catalytic [Tanacetum cinerariifolium]
MADNSSTQVKTKGPNNTLAKGESMEEQEAMEIKAPKNLRTETHIWKLYTDGASNEQGSKAENRKADALSKLAAVQCEGLTKGGIDEELNKRSVDTIEANTIIKEATRTWMTPIQEYIEKKILPEDATEARTIQEKAHNYTVEEGIVQLILFIVDSGCTKHMTGNLTPMCNFVEKYLGFIKSKVSITISSRLVNFVMRICRLSHLNFDYMNLLSKKDVVIGLPKLKYVKDQLCSSCKVSKAKRSPFKTKIVPSSKGRLNLLHIDLCGPMRVARINGKQYIMNGVVERQNRTLVEAARTMLSASKLPLFFWTDAITTACYTQNRSIIISTHEKTAYHIINDRKPSIKHLYIIGCTGHLTRDDENLDKMKEKGDPSILVGYSTQSKGYRVYYKRT